MTLHFEPAFWHPTGCDPYTCTAYTCPAGAGEHSVPAVSLPLAHRITRAEPGGFDWARVERLRYEPFPRTLRWSP